MEHIKVYVHFVIYNLMALCPITEQYEGHWLTAYKLFLPVTTCIPQVKYYDHNQRGMLKHFGKKMKLNLGDIKLSYEWPDSYNVARQIIIIIIIIKNKTGIVRITLRHVCATIVAVEKK